MWFQQPDVFTLGLFRIGSLSDQKKRMKWPGVNSPVVSDSQDINTSGKNDEEDKNITS